jgi:metal-sulfur cluster biosynthetic enzyme
MNEQLTADQCYAALRNVIDPELYQNIVDLGLVYGVEVKDTNHVFVTMTLTTPHCPLGPQILADVDTFLRAGGAAAVDVQIVWEPMWTPAMMSDELKRELGIEEEYGLEAEFDPELEPEPEWTPPPMPKKKGLLGWLFK